MEQVRIWLNRNYSTAIHLLDMLRHNPCSTPVLLYSSHLDQSSPMLAGADHRLQEPDAGDAGFVDTMLQLCLRHDIDVLLPVAGQSLIAHRADDFRAAGTALICPPARAIDTLADKSATFAELGGWTVIPPWRVIRSAAEFDAAVADLDGLWTRARPLIVKPVVGVGGDGVRFLTRTEPALATLLGPVGPLLDIQTLRRALAGIPRTKSGRKRIIGGDPALAGLTAELVQHFRLDGLVNVQFRSFQGRPALLEINTRPSGGLHQTGLAGVNLPWAAVQLALGFSPEPLRPQLGAEFVMVPSVVPLQLPVPGGSALPARDRERLADAVPSA